MKDTCSNNGRGKKKPFVSSEGIYFLCVSSPRGLLTRLSWVSDELRLEINWKAGGGTGATAGEVLGPRAVVGAGLRRLCAI